MANLFKINFNKKEKTQKENDPLDEYIKNLAHNNKNESQINSVLQIPIDNIVPNPNQPRKDFDDKMLFSLSESIKAYGIIQPLTVRKLGTVSETSPPVYELVAGERRLRAARLAGFEVVPCIIAQMSREVSAEVSIIENLQREDLNFFEQAQAIQKLIELFSYSQEQLAAKLSVSQSYIANKIRILKLEPDERKMVLEHNLTERHARALIRLSEKSERVRTINAIIKKLLNVSSTEKYIDDILNPKVKPAKPKSKLVVKDVRILLNSIDRAVTVVKENGIDVVSEKVDKGEYFEVYMKIPKNK